MTTRQLSDTEIKERGQQLAQMLNDLRAEEDSKAEAAAFANERIKGMRAAIGSLAFEVRTGTEEIDDQIAMPYAEAETA